MVVRKAGEGSASLGMRRSLVSRGAWAGFFFETPGTRSTGVVRVQCQKACVGIAEGTEV